MEFSKNLSKGMILQDVVHYNANETRPQIGELVMAAINCLPFF